MFITILQLNFQLGNFSGDTFINSMKLPIFLRFKEAHIFPVGDSSLQCDHHARDKSVWPRNITKKANAHEFLNFNYLQAEFLDKYHLLVWDMDISEEEINN